MSILNRRGSGRTEPYEDNLLSGLFFLPGKVDNMPNQIMLDDKSWHKAFEAKELPDNAALRKQFICDEVKIIDEKKRVVDFIISICRQNMISKDICRIMSGQFFIKFR